MPTDLVAPQESRVACLYQLVQLHQLCFVGTVVQLCCVQGPQDADHI